MEDDAIKITNGAVMILAVHALENTLGWFDHSITTIFCITETLLNIFRM